MLDNIVLMTDSYKFSHYKQYPKGTTQVYDYLESRGGKYDKIVFFGLQYFLKKYLTQKVTPQMVEEAKEICDAHMGPGLFNYDGWMYIAKELDGKLPVEIKTLPEGSVVSTKNLLASIVNTGPNCYWLPGHLETLLMKIWSPITVATTSYECKKIIKKYLSETAENLDGLPFKLHDFGYRGVSSEESAGLNGLAHLVNFLGTDNVKSLVFGKRFYNSDMAGFSIPASEHSTMTALGREGEFDQMKRFLDVYSEAPLKACVSDSYNIYEAIKFWGTQKDILKQQGGILVVRPDSGDPVKMSLECAELLDKEFGHTIVKEKYKLLNQVRVIYGDGISSPEVVGEILENAKKAGYSADNFAFGMGGGLLQKNDRDTQKFAIKCSAAIINGKTVEVYKDPITDPGKISKKGFLDLIKENGSYKTITIEDYNTPSAESELEVVYRNGEVLKEVSLEEIRSRLAETI